MNPKWKIDKFDPQAAHFLGSASQMAYRTAGDVERWVKAWRMELIHFFDVGDTQAFLARTPNFSGSMILAFRGTESLKDWMTDIDVNLVNGPGGKVHDGFLCALNAVWRQLLKLMDATREKRSLWITGHSLGGALATLAAAKFRLEKGYAVNGLYTFGSPRVGNEDFARNFDHDFYYQNYRLVNNNDIVPRVPFRWLSYRHSGIFKYFDGTGRINNKVSWENLTLRHLTGRIEDHLQPGTDGIKDHAIARYVRNLIKLMPRRRPRRG